MRAMKALVVLILLAPLTACFSLDGPVFTASQARQVPGLPGTYETTDGDEVVITAPDDDFDYGMRVRAGGEVMQLALRMVPMGGYHLAQVHDATGAEPGAAVFIVSPDANGVRMHAPPMAGTAELVEKHGLLLTNGTDLSGNEGAIVAFLEDVVTMTMTSDYVLIRKR
jgi:hypothetical protein